MLTKDDYQWLENKRSHVNWSDVNQLGFYGNVWVRSHTYRKAGDVNGDGHYHKFNHVSLLVKGAVRVEVDGCEPKRFIAPTFITIDKDKKHRVTALEDDTIWYCVFALRDVDGEVTDIYSGDNSPYNAISDEEHTYLKIQQLEQQTVLTDK
jgi:hypothetical protein